MRSGSRGWPFRLAETYTSHSARTFNARLPNTVNRRHSLFFGLTGFRIRDLQGPAVGVWAGGRFHSDHSAEGAPSPHLESGVPRARSRRTRACAIRVGSGGRVAWH